MRLGWCIPLHNGLTNTRTIDGCNDVVVHSHGIAIMRKTCRHRHKCHMPSSMVPPQSPLQSAVKQEPSSMVACRRHCKHRMRRTSRHNRRCHADAVHIRIHSCAVARHTHRYKHEPSSMVTSIIVAPHAVNSAVHHCHRHCKHRMRRTNRRRWSMSSQIPSISESTPAAARAVTHQTPHEPSSMVAPSIAIAISCQTRTVVDELSSPLQTSARVVRTYAVVDVVANAIHI